jgi:hypothetical protein
MKSLAIFALILCVAAGSQAALDWSYDWEDGTGTALGKYEGSAGLALENSTEQAQSGTHSLKMTEDPLSGTPQAFIWWVTGLQDGDTVTASFYVYDVTPGGNPSGRIWGHYTASSTDIDDYTGSAGGSDEYPAGTGWSALTNTWTFDSNSGANTGLVVEARIYSSTAPANVIYVDTTYISVSRESAVIHRADGATVPEPAFFGLLPLALLFFRRK